MTQHSQSDRIHPDVRDAFPATGVKTVEPSAPDMTQRAESELRDIVADHRASLTWRIAARAEIERRELPELTEGTSVNDHPWLTHEAIMDAIKRDATGERLADYARECATVGANALARDLAEWAQQRVDIRSIGAPSSLHDVEPSAEIRVTVDYADHRAEFGMYSGELFRRQTYAAGERVARPLWERVDRSGDILDHEQRVTVDALRSLLVAYMNSSRSSTGRPAHSRV